MSRRSGATLLEVLVSIFIMGIGMLAILALFPLGALNMALSIRNDQAATLGRNAVAVAQTFDLRSDTNVVAAMLNPPGADPAAADGPSYPVYIDPIGVQTLISSSTVGNNPAVPRRDVPVAPASSTPRILKWFTLTDDLIFDTKGTPATPLARDPSFSYALLVRRPNAAEAGVVDLAVAVYFRRPLLGSNFQGGEFLFEGKAADGTDITIFDPVNNTIRLNATNRAAPIRTGVWLLDCTRKSRAANTGYAHGYFYRAVSVTEISQDIFEIEVSPPIRGFSAAGTGSVIVMDGVIDVFEKGTGWRP